jgi:hypothetical protein
MLDYQLPSSIHLNVYISDPTHPLLLTNLRPRGYCPEMPFQIPFRASAH